MYKHRLYRLLLSTECPIFVAWGKCDHFSVFLDEGTLLSLVEVLDPVGIKAWTTSRGGSRLDPKRISDSAKYGADPV